MTHEDLKRAPYEFQERVAIIMESCGYPEEQAIYAAQWGEQHQWNPETNRIEPVKTTAR